MSDGIAKTGPHQSTDEHGRRQQLVREHYQTLSALYDVNTFRHLEWLGVSEGWRCWEVGAGAPTVPAWLAQHVTPTGHVLATDIDAAPVRAYLPQLLDDVLAGRIHPGRVFDVETDLDGIAEAHAAMDERRAVKSLVRIGSL